MYLGETDPNKKYWRCPTCNAINPVLVDRADIIRDDERDYWRYKIAKYRLKTFITDWLTHLYMTEMEGWCAELPEHLQGERADPKEIVKARVLYVRSHEAIRFMEEVPLLVSDLLNWGFSLDNPGRTAEADALRSCLIDELRRLAQSKQRFHTEAFEECWGDGLQQGRCAKWGGEVGKSSTSSRI